MKLTINKELEHDNIKIGRIGKIYFQLSIGYFNINWFTECGDWFIYITFKNKGIRFSSAGFFIF